MSTYIYETVQSLIEKYNTSDPYRLIKLMGIKLVYMNEAKTLMGVYTVVLRQRTIIIRQNLGKLKKSILAHELGHDSLHRHIKNKDNMVNFLDDALYAPYDSKEMEANIFACHLLIPDDRFLSLYKENLSFAEMANIFEVPIEFVNLKSYELYKMGMLDAKSYCFDRPSGDFLSKNYG
ncbi:ImmA/IrrE family metallo-endopeptidase [Criibacterium bergeronii]|uniref:ImmA/IrrE family metallo-endopeptidase n=1 Tax=Criibacterium bergeronii TaxID=1871336 RepID=A0A371IK48_9FIRM|nr:ImmA/IrrE family metallo-endopeptidase [Criibacterium bergeronii]RDY20840.1 ImmA/IrrE family metallo-endopeptidase [Criibacterium bergeronii]